MDEIDDLEAYVTVSLQPGVNSPWGQIQPEAMMPLQPFLLLSLAVKQE